MQRKLIPYQLAPYPLVFEVELSFQQKNPPNPSQLTITYHLTGEALNEINLLSEPHSPPDRSHDLWKNTCFEWFLKINSNSSKYWEFNASPTGSWNFYELESYRAPLKESNLLMNPTFQSQLMPASSSKAAVYSFTFQGELNPTLFDFQKDHAAVRLAITSVIKWRSDKVSYYSLQHPKEKPDFHSPEGFVLSLLGSR